MNMGVTWLTLEDYTWGDIEGESWEGLTIYNEGEQGWLCRGHQDRVAVGS